MDTSLKQRLIGAIVLVALAVIFLPMLVTGPARDSAADDVSITVPGAPDNAQFETRELPLAAPAAGSTGLQGATPLQEPADTPLPTVDASPAVAAGNYAVTFGAYASQADAEAVIAGLKRARLPGFSEPATIAGKPAWRVRVGPFADRAQAESARVSAVQVRNDVKAEVITLDAAGPGAAEVAAATPLPEPVQPRPAPAASTPKPVAATSPARTETRPAPAARPASAPAAPAASTVGFAVQLGAFAQAADANTLRDKARAAGFSAFVEQVRTDKGTLSRVRVGPVASRAEADRLKALLAARIGVAGMVRPHP